MNFQPREGEDKPFKKNKRVARVKKAFSPDPLVITSGFPIIVKTPYTEKRAVARKVVTSRTLKARINRKRSKTLIRCTLKL